MGTAPDTTPYAVDREIEDLEVLVSAADGGRPWSGCRPVPPWPRTPLPAARRSTHLVMWEPPFRLDAEGQRQTEEYNAQLRALLAEGDPGGALELFMRMVRGPGAGDRRHAAVAVLGRG